MLLPIGPMGETVAASKTQGNIRRRQPTATATQRHVQPMPWIHPSTNWVCWENPPIQVTSNAVKISDSNAE